MKKLTVSEASKYFGITKEAIYNRVRRGKLKTVNENGLKYVVVENEEKATLKPRQNSKTAIEKYINFLENEVEELKERIKKLESENRSLVDEKLNLLESSKRELETIFNKRDEQLKQILHLMNEKYALPKIQSVEVIDTNIKKRVEKKPKKIKKIDKKSKTKKSKKIKKGKK